MKQITIDKNDGFEVVSNLSNSGNAIDFALLEIAQLTSSVIDAGSKAKAPHFANQKTLKALSESLNQIVDGRGRLAAARVHMLAVKSQSNLDVYDFGCLDGRPKGVIEEIMQSENEEDTAAI